MKLYKHKTIQILSRHKEETVKDNKEEWRGSAREVAENLIRQPNKPTYGHIESGQEHGYYPE